MSRHSNNRLRDTYLPVALLAADTVVTFAALYLAFIIRYKSPIGRLGVDVPNANLADYLPLLVLGAALLIASFAQQGLYDGRVLLRRYQNLNLILKGAAFWLVAYLCVSLVLKFTPPISRLFVVIGFLCVVAVLYLWRSLVHAVLSSPSFQPRLQRRAVLLGWNANASTLLAEISRDAGHPMVVGGIITLPGDPVPSVLPHLGEVGQLASILEREPVDLLVATRVDLRRMELRQVVEICERAYVEWKIVPAAFDIFISGLRLQTIGRTPVLGVEDLRITKLFSRFSKRLVDLLGATLGLLLSAPLVALLALLIRRESPDGPVFFRQIRIGAGHRAFTLYKLRSMLPDASASDHQRQSTRRGDPRLLRIGAFMRRWNLDELPQFWNVLRGQMSLVGPRPERPYHVDQLTNELPHYLPRHLVKPGMTGWAQINGLRGESSIERRLQHDIYYIENWSLWLDVQILLLTFVRWKNEAE
jgi:exopolysaccharide biosynthesis polyprenyl glycosylphosphotransferase